MKIPKMILGLLCIFLLDGCLGQRSSTPLVTPSGTDPEKTKVVITEVATHIIPTRTPTFPPLPTATATKVNIVQANCPSIEPASSLPEIDGQLIMNGFNHNHLPDYSDAELDYLLILKTGAKRSLSTKNYNY